MRASAKLICPTHPTLHLYHANLDSFIWNTLIRAHFQATISCSSANTHSPLSIFLRMRLHGVAPDFHTFPFLLQSFCSPSNLYSGKKVHAQALLSGFSNDSFVQTSLINMYSSCGNLTLAHQVFDDISLPDLPSWNSIINANIKVGLINIARDLFNLMPVRNVISWSCMINGYVTCGDYKEALNLFRQMQALDVNEVHPNAFTMSAVLAACGRLGALEHGKWAHAYIKKCGMQIDVVLGTSLVDMYAKCGSIERAKWVFTNMGSNKDVTAWTAMVSGLAMHGHAEECLELLKKMIADKFKPNSVTFLGALSACVHGGLVTQGKELFKTMRQDFNVIPLIQHYGCMVDLYSRAGQIEDAWKVIKSMPMEPDVLIWGSLLSGSRIHGNTETCETALRKLIELDPKNSGAYVLLSNVYAKKQKWSQVRGIRALMEGRGVKKVPGCSLVEVEGVLHEFLVGDESHPETKEIYLMLEEIMRRLKMKGYTGNAEEGLLDLEEEEREAALSLHSERLAIAFCFLKTSPGTPIQIVKNLRICGDCHAAIKMISKEFSREIVVRDCNRFHHFVDGFCSCKDYW